MHHQSVRLGWVHWLDDKKLILDVVFTAEEKQDIFALCKMYAFKIVVVVA